MDICIIGATLRSSTYMYEYNTSINKSKPRVLIYGLMYAHAEFVACPCRKNRLGSVTMASHRCYLFMIRVVNNALSALRTYYWSLPLPVPVGACRGNLSRGLTYSLEYPSRAAPRLIVLVRDHHSGCLGLDWYTLIAIQYHNCKTMLERSMKVECVVMLSLCFVS